MFLDKLFWTICPRPSRQHGTFQCSAQTVLIKFCPLGGHQIWNLIR